MIHLSSLVINISNNDEVKVVLENIPKIKELNNEKITKEDLIQLNINIKDNEIEENSKTNILKQDIQLETIEEISESEKNNFENSMISNFQPLIMEEISLSQGAIDTMKNLFSKIVNEIDKEEIIRKNGEKEYELFSKKVISQSLKNLNESKTISSKNAHVYLALTSLNEYLANQLIKIISNKDKELSQILNKVIEMFLSIIRGLISQSISSALLKEVDFSNKNTLEILEVAENVEKELKQKVLEYNLLNAKHISMQKEAQAKIEELQLELSIYKDSKKFKRNELNQSLDVLTDSPIKIMPEILALNNQSYTSDKEIKNRKLSPASHRNNAKHMSLKQIKDVIQDIFNSKIKFDEKCKQLKAPCQTMEQYMYTFLNQRYGLKHLIIEWASGIINGIRKYANMDNDITLFCKILKNECDEDFRFIQSQIKSAVYNIMKESMQNKYKYKTNDEINKMCLNLQYSYLDESLWNEIIKKMYNQEHAILIEEKIYKFIEESEKKFDNSFPYKTKVNPLNKLENVRIRYSDLMKIILDFQLKNHEAYIRKFSLLFKIIDKDTNGVINDNEFSELVRGMNVCENDEEMNRLLLIIDPNKNNKITFSECVSLFSVEKINQEGISDDNPTILEKFLYENT